MLLRLLGLQFQYDMDAADYQHAVIQLNFADCAGKARSGR
jgi:hypothetical protein